MEKAINKLILLQNKVKIRYVNNTNLLDYLYAKYNVGSSEDLIRMWEVYQKEKEEREKVRELDMELDALRRELLTILRRYQIRDPEMWLDQVSAIANEKEMVELRHQLILRRQKLRKQMEYNEKLGENAKGKSSLWWRNFLLLPRRSWNRSPILKNPPVDMVTLSW